MVQAWGITKGRGQRWRAVLGRGPPAVQQQEGDGQHGRGAQYSDSSAACSMRVSNRAAALGHLPETAPNAATQRQRLPCCSRVPPRLARPSH